MQMNVPALPQKHDDSDMAGFRGRILRQNSDLFYKIVRFVTVYRTKDALAEAIAPALSATLASPELRLHHRNRKNTAEPVGLTVRKIKTQQVFARTA